MISFHADRHRQQCDAAQDCQKSNVTVGLRCQESTAYSVPRKLTASNVTPRKIVKRAM
jgi:hypothetical protein